MSSWHHKARKFLGARENIFWTRESPGRNMARGSGGTWMGERKLGRCIPVLEATHEGCHFRNVGGHKSDVPCSPTLRCSHGRYPHPKCFGICILAPMPPPLGPRKCHQQRGAGAGGPPESRPRPRVFTRASSPALLRWLDVGLSYSWRRDAHQHRGSLHLMYGC